MAWFEKAAGDDRRRRPRGASLLVVVVASLFLTSCAQPARTTAGAPDPSARTSRSLQAERAQAARFDEQIRAQTRINRDQVINRYMRRIASRIQPQRPAGAPPPVVRVINDDTPNAFTTGGGYVYFHTGLLKIMQSEAELAMVMGHEMAHGDLNHINEGRQAAATANVMSQLSKIIIGSTIGSGVGGQLAGVGAGLALQAGFTNFSRNQEREADLIGFRYIGRAGYNTAQGARSFERLQRASRGRRGVPWLSTHPLSSERLRTLSDLAARQPGGDFVGRQAYRDNVLRRLR